MIKSENTIAKEKLKALHSDAKKDFFRMSKGLVKAAFRPIQPKDLANVYLPISQIQGEDLGQLIVEHDCKQVIEFGTSFGISTIYLADAVRQTGGKVITTELIESKANTAKLNIKEAGLSAFVDIRIGDAMKTLSELDGQIDFLFLDGWKNLYLPLFKMLEPQFHKGTIIYADNIDMTDAQDYAYHISENREKYSTAYVHQNKGMISKVL